jgi:type I restriction enzyme S subunit
MTWRTLSLKEICKVDWGNTNLTKSAYVKDGKYLAVSAAGADGLINQYEHEANVPVLSAIGAQCGRMFYPGERFTAIKNTITLTPKENVVDGKFLYYLFTYVELPQRGAAQPFISKGDIEKFRVSIPASLEEQRNIVTKLDQAFEEIDLAISQNNAQVILLKQICSQEIEKIFFRNVYKWPETTIEKSCEYKNGKAHEQLVVPNGEFRLVTSKFVSSEGSSARLVSKALTPLESGDIAIVLSDLPNGKALAKAFLVESETDLTLNQRVLRVRSKHFDPKFLYFLLNRNPYLLSFDNGESQTHLKLAQVLACPLFLPDKETQLVISSRIDQIKFETEQAIKILESKTSLIKALRGSILNNIFSRVERVEEVA